MTCIKDIIVRAVFVLWLVVAFGVAGMWDMEEAERAACVEVRYGN